MTAGENQMFESDIEAAESKLATALGENTLLRFREDVGEIYTETVDHSDASEFQQRRWVHIGRRGLDETEQTYITLEKGLNLLDVTDAILSAGLFFVLTRISGILGLPQTPSIIVALLLSLVLYFVNTGLVLAKALIRQIAFPKEEIHPRLPPSELRFRAGWNKGVIQSSSSILGLVILGVISSPGSTTYNTGLKGIEWYAKRKAR